MTKIYFISCKYCKKDYLIGIDGKELINVKTSNGKLGKTHYIAIGNDELNKQPLIGSKTNCRICGVCCKVNEKGSN